MKKKIIIIIVIVLICLIGAFSIKINKVSITGNKIYSSQEIEDTLFADQKMYHSFYFLLHKKLFGLKQMPFIQEMDVKWNGPTELKIQIYEKKICGCVKYMGRYVYFDKDGIVLQSLSKRLSYVPLIEGVTFGKFTIMHKLDVKDKTLFDKIMNLSQLINHYKIDVDKVAFDQENVMIYSGDIVVNLGNKKFYDDEMVALSSVLKTTKEKKLSGTIDMQDYQSGDKIILKTKEN